MTVSSLTQVEADSLMAMEKLRADDKVWSYPVLGGGISVRLVSTDEREAFMLDIRRSRIHLAKGSYQNRGRQIVVLARLCFGGPPHVNPDGEDIESPHVHTYREGYGDKWAYPPSDDTFPDLDDRWKTFQDFMSFCNIVEPPDIRRGLFV